MPYGVRRRDPKGSGKSHYAVLVQNGEPSSAVVLGHSGAKWRKVRARLVPTGDEARVPETSPKKRRKRMKYPRIRIDQWATERMQATARRLARSPEARRRRWTKCYAGMCLTKTDSGRARARTADESEIIRKTLEEDCGLVRALDFLAVCVIPASRYSRERAARRPATAGSTRRSEETRWARDTPTRATKRSSPLASCAAWSSIGTEDRTASIAVYTSTLLSGNKQQRQAERAQRGAQVVPQSSTGSMWAIARR